MAELPITKRNSLFALALIVFFFLGMYIGGSGRSEIEEAVTVANKNNPVADQVDFNPFWKTWNLLNEKYPAQEQVTDQNKVYGAISGLVDSLNDPYSVFFTPEEAKAFQEEIAGNFNGVGMEVGVKDNTLTVIAPLKGTPAEKAGILSGDQILKIDDTITTGLGIDEAIKLIRGERGTTVTLTISRKGFEEPKEFAIVRDVINIPTLDTELRPDGIFIVKLYSFSANATSLFSQAMRKFVESGSSKLLLDLRGNPGGYLDAAVDIGSWFLPGGKVIVTEDYGASEKPKIFRSQGKNLFNEKLKFVILINEGSASASEIVAGAMQDHGRAKLVGKQSFGKGSVQEVVDITSDTLLKITVAKWLTPNGNLIHDKGLTPDYPVEFTKEDMEAKRDPQMNKAIELLKSGNF